MSKFKIGDHVRVTKEGSLHDCVGFIVGLNDGRGNALYSVDIDGTVWGLKETSLTLADHEPHTTNDPVSHPSHYTSHPSGVECLTITRHMGFNTGNAMKYLWRADLKNDAIEDLKKAAFYIADEIKKREAAK